MENVQATLDTPEQEVSLQDDIRSAIESVSTETEKNDTIVNETKSERVRDDSGKFAKAETVEQPVEVQTEIEQPVVKPRPSSWKKDYEQHWSSLDPSLQDYLHQRESDYAKGVSTYKNQWDSVAPLVQAIEPFRPILQQHNVDPAQWISNLGRAHSTLALGTPEQKMQMFYQLANDYGVPIGEMTGQGSDPQFSMLAQKLNQIENQWSSFQNMQQQTEQQVLQSEIQSFKDANPHFDDVRDQMAGLLQAGMADDLQSAYDKAIRLNDDVWGRVQAEKHSTSTAEKLQVAAQAKAKAVSPKSSTPTANVKAGNGTLADDIRSAIEQHL